jgi:hypothetical protein
MLPVAEAPVIVSGLVGCVAFACACFLFGVFPVDDVRALRALVRGRVDALGLVRAG